MVRRKGRRSTPRAVLMVLAVAALTVVNLAATLALRVEPAAACTCANVTVADGMEWGGTGFIGTLVEKGPRLDRAIGITGADTPYRFTVEQWLYGEPDDDPTELIVYSAAFGESCGFEVDVGERVAVLTQEQDGVLTGGLCSTLPADVALAELHPPRAEAGTARLALIGDFDDNLIAYFSDDGRFLGYDGDTERAPARTWQPRSFPCADGLHAVVADGATYRTIELATGEDATAPVDLAEDTGAAVLRCREVGDLLLWYRADTGDVRVFEPATGATQDIDVRFGGGHVAATDQGVAVVESLDPGERVLLVDPSGETREIGRLTRRGDEPHRGYASLEASPDGRELALLEVSYLGGGSATSLLRLVDVATGQTRASVTVEAETSGARWLGDDHIGVSLHDGDWVTHLAVLDAATLESQGMIRNWPAGNSVLVDGAVWGVGDGTLYRAELAGEPQPLFTLPVRTWATPIPVAQPVDRVPPAADGEGDGEDRTDPGAATDEVPAVSAVDDGERTAPRAPEGSASTVEVEPGRGSNPWWPIGALTGLVVTLVGWLALRSRFRPPPL